MTAVGSAEAKPIGMSLLGTRAIQWARAFLFAVAVIGLWEIVSGTTWIVSNGTVSTPAQALSALVSLCGTGGFWGDVGSTLASWGFGLAIAFIVAVLAGLAIGSSRLLYRLVQAPIEFSRAIPSITILPLAVLVLGVQLKLVVVLVAVGALWPLLIQAVYAVQDVDPGMREMGRVYQLGGPGIFRWIVLPGTLPYLLTGLRISAVVALNVTIAVEMLIGSTGGLGDAINKMQIADRLPDMYAYVIACGVLGIVINVGIRRAEHVLLHWHASQRDQVPA